MLKNHDFQIIEAILAINLTNVRYYYAVDHDLVVQEGSIVIVPFKNRDVYGIVLHQVDQIDFALDKLKYIKYVFPQSLSFQRACIDFLLWFANYNMQPLGKVLKLMLNNAHLSLKTNYEWVNLTSKTYDATQLSPKTLRVLKVLQDHPMLTKQQLLQEYQVSQYMYNKLLNAGLLYLHKEYIACNKQQNLQYQGVKLNNLQQNIVNAIQSQLSHFIVHVLKGVPGAGKTEVYFAILSQVLKQKQQVLILLPEIGLIAQVAEKFKLRFQVDAYVWHSEITVNQKNTVWVSAKLGNLQVIIGTRSALFLTFNHLGLIIVDEEHDVSYKQEESIIYNARDMAVMRAKLLNIPILLVSATPSLETMMNVKKAKYILHTLTSRYNFINLPSIQLIDNKTSPKIRKGSLLTKELVNAMLTTLHAKEQCLLFINKRGYASYVVCQQCGEVQQCKNCDITLVYHKQQNILLCHYCGYYSEYNTTCLSCLAKDAVTSVGYGIEQVYEDVKKLFDQYNVLLISSDTMTSYDKLRNMITAVNNKQYDILIGTQLITKGYHFPYLTLVAILDGDCMHSFDLKASEKAWQMIYQVAGRSGREIANSKVYIQTYRSNNIFIQSLMQNDYSMFLNDEEQRRIISQMPPFIKLAAILLTSSREHELKACCATLLNHNIKLDNTTILGPIEAPIYYLRGKYRQRMLIKAPNIQLIHQAIQRLKSISVNFQSIKMQIDIDPINFL